MVAHADQIPAPDKRAAPRFNLDAPVELKDGAGVARDMSTSGVYFTCENGMPMGSRISLTILLDATLDNPPLRLHCQGEVVRVAADGTSVGIAVKIHDYTLGD